MKISLIVSVLNEQDAIPIFYHSVRGLAALSGYTVEIIFTNDGSTDSTAKKLNKIIKKDKYVAAIHFTRNLGKEVALFAGLK